MRRLAGIAIAFVLGPAAGAQQPEPVPLSRGDAIGAALSRGARLGVARADTAAALAGVLTARALPNPVLSSSHSKSTPNYHVAVELPIDLPGLRSARIGSAEAARRSAQYRFAYERAAIALDADTTYTRAMAALERARLSQRNARDADSLLRIAVARRDAGDASDLDVELATVNAGQRENDAASDSLTAVATLLELQTIIGLASDGVSVAPTDSLVPPSTDSAGFSGGAPLTVAAAEASFASAQLAARLQRRSLFASPSLSAGFETGDPSGAEPGVLPTVGIAFPLPLLNRNRGPVMQAEAERERARAKLELARLETRARIARTTRERATAMARVERDRRLLASARRVAAMSLTAYREGESSLPNVLEAQRSSRDILSQYVDDVAAAWIATAALRVFTLSASSR